MIEETINKRIHTNINITSEIRKQVEMSKNKTKQHVKLYRMQLRGKFITVNIYIKKQISYNLNINNLKFYLKKLEKEN